MTKEEAGRLVMDFNNYDCGDSDIDLLVTDMNKGGAAYDRLVQKLLELDEE